MTTTADHADDRPQGWEASDAALVRSAATESIAVGRECAINSEWN
jgi:hypothetical protein